MGFPEWGEGGTLKSLKWAAFAIDEIFIISAGNRTILLFSYPIDRKKILGAKIFMVFSYTVISMLLCGAVVLGIFLKTEPLLRFVQKN